MVPLAAGPLPLFFERHMKNARPFRFSSERAGKWFYFSSYVSNKA